jgi:outer membrane protein OmpA-like peptidoglycan-associated protein
MKRAFTVTVCLALIVSLTACANMNRQQRGTGTGVAVGAGVGAILGQAIGRSTEGTLAGAAIGAAIGGLAGNQIGAYMDRQEQELRQVAAQSDAASIQRENDVLIATFKSDVMFDFDSAVVKPAFHQELVRVSDVLNRYPQTTLVVQGHTDKRGRADYNQRLSERRAEAVRDVLVSNGIAPERIQTAGFGSTMPVSDQDALNRRVSIVIRPVAQG